MMWSVPLVFLIAEPDSSMSMSASPPCLHRLTSEYHSVNRALKGGREREVWSLCLQLHVNVGLDTQLTKRNKESLSDF